MLAYSRGQQPLRFRQAWLKIGSKTDFSQGALFQEVESPTVIVGSGCPFERVSALTWTAKMVETQGNHWLLLTQLQEYDRRGCSLHCIFLSEPRYFFQIVPDSSTCIRSPTKDTAGSRVARTRQVSLRP